MNLLIINKYLMYLMSRSKDAAVCEDCDLEWRKIFFGRNIFVNDSIVLKNQLNIQG